MERLKKYVQNLSFLDLKDSFYNPIDALNYLNENSIDLLFLDINMKELSGISLLQSSNFKGKVIISTAYDKYALKGFELNVADYLLKPYTFERFANAVTKVKDSLETSESQNTKTFLFIKTENRLEKINFSDIIYIEGMGDYRRIHCQSKKVMTLQTFGELEKLIPKELIPRVHKSFMVSIDKIESIEKNQILLGNKVIPISDGYRLAFLSLIGKS
jgi:two-component system LytT family response regulator